MDIFFLFILFDGFFGVLTIGIGILTHRSQFLFDVELKKI